MTYQLLFTLVSLLLTTSLLHAENVLARLNLKKGLTLTYRTEQTTKVQQVIGDNTTSTKNEMTLTKEWKVTDVNKDGIAKLEMSLTSLRLRTTLPSGETLLFDSNNLKKSDEQLRPQLEKYVGVPLAVLDLNSMGKVILVKQAKNSPGHQFERDLPFVIELPLAALQVGSKWIRKYPVTLNPPLGTGEQYETTQKYTCKAIENQKATITFNTIIKDLPKAKLDQIPLFQSQPEGEVLFDLKNGRMLKANHHVLKTLKDHQGTGSSYQFESTYNEQLLSAKE